MVFSEDVGLGKPAPSIFLEACRQAREQPRHCSHVGDNVDADVIPSRALGMRGICLDRSARLAVESPVITTLDGLPSALTE
jgi:putative hydrolase of the HAD superfamily